MRIDRVAVGYMECNCYIIGDDNKVIVIDPGDDYDKISKIINDREVLGVIVTHRHFDHIGCLDRFDCPIYDKNNLKEGKNNIDSFCFDVIYTPGHTDDSISIYFDKEKVMFTGDFLFKDSIGRTDLGGNDLDMSNTIDMIKKYDDDIVIYPGHGEDTILGYEKNNNPFF